MASATEWRIERGKPEAWGARTRFRGPYRVLRAVFGSDGDAVHQASHELAKVTTAWMLKKKNGSTTVLIYDRQSDDDRKFNLDSFRARPHYDWYVVGKDDAALKDFCTWLSREVIKRVEAEPQPRRLTAKSRDKVNALVAQGKSIGDAMKLAAEWEIILPAAEAYKWPIAELAKEKDIVVKERSVARVKAAKKAAPKSAPAEDDATDDAAKPEQDAEGEGEDDEELDEAPEGAEGEAEG